MAAIILIYTGMISLGRWQLDEFDRFRSMRADPNFLETRLRWSPRPIGEVLYYIYGWLVNYFHKPLIIPFLGLLWAIFLAAGMLTYWQKRHRLQENQASQYLLLALCLMVLFLSGHGITEVFYWPAGAVAYLPTLAATFLLFLQITSGSLATSSGRTLAGCCLFVAAGTSECGAAFVFFYALIQGARWVSVCSRRHKTRFRRSQWWWVAPGLIAVLVLLCVRMNRLNVIEFPEMQASPVRGHPLTSLVVGMIEMVVELAGKDTLLRLSANHSVSQLFPELLSSRLPMEILLATGVALCWSRLPRVRKEVASRIREVIGALLLASLCTIAEASLHFGFVCCDRHECLRECWMVMCIAGLAISSSARITPERFRQRAKYSFLGPLILCVAVLPLLHPQLLFRTYRDYASVRRSREENFQAGFQADARQMVFSVVPSTGVIVEEPIKPGTYTLLPGKNVEFTIGNYPYIILEFFGKQNIVVKPCQLP